MSVKLRVVVTKKVNNYLLYNEILPIKIVRRGGLFFQGEKNFAKHVIFFHYQEISLEFSCIVQKKITFSCAL